MLKKFLVPICFALLTLGFVFTPFSVKAAASDEYIAGNRVDYSIVSSDKAPEVLNEEINLYKGSEGFIYYTDSNSGDLYIAIMLGQRPNLGYEIKVNFMEDVEGMAYVSADEICPDKDAINPQVVNYPYTIIKSELPAYKVCVKNSSGKVYDYLGYNEAVPIIGVSWTLGSLQNIYTTDEYIFLEILDSNREPRLFYVSNSYDWKNKIGNLKLNTTVSVRFSLGTPEKLNEMYAFPLSEVNIPVDKESLTDSNWEDIGAYFNVPADKKWIITFQPELGNYTLNSSDIYIADSEGNIIPTVLTLSEDKKSITIIPYKNYKLGGKYCLFITKASNYTTSSLYGLRMNFQIIDNVDISK